MTHVNPLCRKHKPGSIGVPLPSTQARIVDMETGKRVLPVGEIGELVVSGPQVMSHGYLNQPEESADAVRDGWLFTGDIARMDADGYFFIVGRKKDTILVDGFNVYPREVDEVLLTHPKIAEAATVGVPHKLRGEQVKSFIVLKPGEKMTVEEVKDFCRNKLAAYKMPRRIEFCSSSLPKSAMGKVLHRVLRENEQK